MVLFAWMQFLKEETLSYLNISSPYELKMCQQGNTQGRTPSVPQDAEDCGGAVGCAAAEEEIDERAVQDVESLSSLIREILDFDQAQRRKCFNSKMYLCNICFCEKLGRECMYFTECSHVYCKACLKDYFEIQIRDGQVHCLNCPEPKCSSVATPGQVRDASGGGEGCVSPALWSTVWLLTATQGNPLSEPHAFLQVTAGSWGACFACWQSGGIGQSLN